MNILITGGAGFIGSNFVHHVVQKRPDWRVTVLDALTYAGNLDNIGSLINDEKIQFVKADITDQEAIASLWAKEKFDLLFHFAAESHVDRSIESAQEFVRTNVLGTQVLLNVALDQGLKKFVHVSTDEVYGSLGPTGFFKETTPLDPTSPYAASKAASDLIVLAFQKTHGIEAVITRCTNNYGPFQFPEKLIPLFITNALEDKPLPLYGDGMNVRSWIYVTDHCEALLAVADRGKAGQAYNIGGPSDAEVPNKIITKKILSILEKPETLVNHVTDRLAHDRRYAVDITKIKTELGWEPEVHLEEGLQKTIEWYRTNQSWWEKIGT